MGHSIGDTRFSLPALLKIGPPSSECGPILSSAGRLKRVSPMLCPIRLRHLDRRLVVHREVDARGDEAQAVGVGVDPARDLRVPG